MDDSPPPYDVVAPMAQAVAPDNPPGLTVSSSQAAGPRVLLQPGGTLQERVALTDEAEFSLKDVIQTIKHAILPGVLVTDQEFHKWIDMIYADDWHPGKFCEGGSDRMTRRSANDCAYTLGTLRETLQISAKRAGKPRPRSFSEHRVHSQTAPRATEWWRRAGAPVRLLVEHKQHGIVSFSLRDHKFSIIQADAKVNYNGGGMAEAYFHAMRRNDEFMASAVHRFNLLQGIYICRNRLTHWSNPGVLAGLLPHSEKLTDALSELRFCRYAVSSTKSSFFA